MAQRDSGALDIDDLKLHDLTMQVGRIVRAIEALPLLDPGAFLKDGFRAEDAERITHRARLRRWRQLYPVRDLVQRLQTALRDAERTLDARYGMVEQQLCGLGKSVRRRRSRLRTTAKS